MVRITNGREIYEVTNGAYETIFKDQGFTVVDEKASKHKKVVQSEEAVASAKEDFADAIEYETVEGTTNEAGEFDDLIEKPISQWSKNEVKDFAAAKNIDIKGTKSVADAKAIIKEYLDKANEE